MNIFLQKVPPENREILFRLLQYSLFEESISDQNEMNDQALFEYGWFDRYFTDSDRDAYFIKEEGSSRLLGFAMINTFVQRSDRGRSIAEFMVIPQYRRKGVGRAAAIECFEKYRGSWEVSPARGSETAYRFWKHVIDGYTGGNNEFKDGIFSFYSRKRDQDKDKDRDYTQEYAYSPVKTFVLKEQEIPYGALPQKRQGEYTVEDYYNLPDDRRAELIDGVIYDMAAPSFVHQRLAGEILFQITSYIKKKKGSCIPMASPVDVRLDCDDKTMVQPDVLILCGPEKIRSWGIDGAPDFVLEIVSPSTGRKDYVTKLHKYADAGVKEYWILDPERKVLITYCFEEEGFFHMQGLGGKAKMSIFGGDLEIDLDEAYAVIEEVSRREGEEPVQTGIQ